MEPFLQPTRKRVGQSEVSLESSFAEVRRFHLGVGLDATREAAGEPNTSTEGESPTPTGALKPVLDIESLLPKIRQVLEHLEYFLHTDLHLLCSLWKVRDHFWVTGEGWDDGWAGWQFIVTPILLREHWCLLHSKHVHSEGPQDEVG